MEVPSDSQNQALQDRYNRTVNEEVNNLKNKVVALEEQIAYIKAIPVGLTTVPEVVNYLRNIV